MTWEQSIRADFLAFRKGTGPIAAAWRQTLEAEVSSVQGQSTVTVMWDLSDFYEHIQRGQLQQDCQEMGSPQTIVTVAYSMYSAPRYIKFQGIVAVRKKVDRGVPAGDTFATTFVQAYMVRKVNISLVNFKWLNLVIYIDDFVFQCSHYLVAKVAKTVVETAMALKELTTVDLGCNLSPGKAAVVANSKEALERVRKALGELAGPEGAATPPTWGSTTALASPGRATSQARSCAKG